MHENILATLSITAKYCKDLMPSYTRISKLWQIDVKDYYTAINTMIIMIMQQNGKQHNSKHKKRNKKYAGYSLGNVFFMDMDWKNEDNGLCMNLFKSFPL